VTKVDTLVLRKSAKKRLRHETCDKNTGRNENNNVIVIDPNESESNLIMKESYQCNGELGNNV
jgi:hypothetical protein